jgi:hypothetical protein
LWKEGAGGCGDRLEVVIKVWRGKREREREREREVY